MPISKLTVDERISDWVYATNDIIDELNNGIGDRTQLLTQSKVIVSAINTVGGEAYWTEEKLQDGSVHTVKIKDEAITTSKLEDNIEIPGSHIQLATGSTAQRPTQGSVSSSIFYNGDAGEEFIITGTGFDINGVQVYLVGNDNSEVAVTNLVVVSSEIVKITIPQTLDPTLKPYSVKIINNNLASQPETVSVGTLSFGGGPVWIDNAVVLDFNDYESHLQGNVQHKLVATDPDKTALTYALVSGTLPDGATVEPTGILNIPECPPQFTVYNNPTAFQFVASASDDVNPAVNSGTLQINVRPQKPSDLLPSNIGMAAWYQAASYSAGQWLDESGNERHITNWTNSANVYKNTWTLNDDREGTDGTRELAYLSMDPNAGFRMPFTLGTDVPNWTVFLVSRYGINNGDDTGLNGTRGRLLQGSGSEGNFLIGGWNGWAGTYYNDNPVAWWEPNSQRYFHYGNNWFAMSVTANSAMANGVDRSFYPGSGSTGPFTLANGPLGKYTGDVGYHDYAEIIIFDSVLTEQQQRDVHAYLEWKYGMDFFPGDTPRIGLQFRNSAGTSTQSVVSGDRMLKQAENGLVLTIEGGGQWGTPSYTWANLEGTIFDGMLATSDINTEANTSIAAEMNGVFFTCDRRTKVYLVRQDTWNAISDINTWTRRSDLDGLWISNHTTNFFVYEKEFSAGVHNIDTNSAMYLFADAEDGITSAVEWSRDI
jgi:hypothetical protein